jgi:hypothetical protein
VLATLREPGRRKHAVSVSEMVSRRPLRREAKKSRERPEQSALASTTAVEKSTRGGSN